MSSKASQRKTGWSTPFKFVVYRDPLERFLSAFIDKCITWRLKEGEGSRKKPPLPRTPVSVLAANGVTAAPSRPTRQVRAPSPPLQKAEIGHGRYKPTNQKTGCGTGSCGLCRERAVGDGNGEVGGGGGGTVYRGKKTKRV